MAAVSGLLLARQHEYGHSVPMMLFTTLAFVLFFAGVWFIYTFLCRSHSTRLGWLILASLAFYATYSLKSVAYLVSISAVVYYLTAAIARERKNARRRFLLFVAATAFSVGVLSIFKYTGFLVNNLNHLLQASGRDPLTFSLALSVPAGISFFTFHNISYTVEVYTGGHSPARGFLQFLASVAFFPKLLAGPITRPNEILPQIEILPAASWPQVRDGLVLVAVGAFKKTVGDLMTPLALSAFDGAPHSVMDQWTSLLASAGQVYADFSGYTDMALGLALMLGISLPPNFRLPYLASSPTDFWSRWHLTLSLWLKDYLFLPLATSASMARALFAISITFAIGGLWHGAGWTFVLWGLYHGLLVVISYTIATMLGGPRQKQRYPWTELLPVRVLKIVATFYLVSLGLIFFRSPDAGAAFGFLRTMHTSSSVPSVMTFAASLSLALALAGLVVVHGLDALMLRFPASFRRPLLFYPFAVLCILLTVLAPIKAGSFVYMEF